MIGSGHESHRALSRSMGHRRNGGIEMDEESERAPESKEELIRLIEDSHAELEGTIALLRHEQTTEPLLEGGWSVKDVLAHVAAWHDLTVARLEARADKRLAQIEGDME